MEITYLDQFFQEVGAWFQALSSSIWVFNQGYKDHWVLGALVDAVLTPLSTLLYNAGTRFLNASDTFFAMDFRQLQDKPWNWVVNKVEGHFPGFAWLVDEPVKAVRWWFSHLAFPGMPITDDLFLWVIDCGEEVFPGFRLFLLDPADYIRKLFSRAIFPDMSVAEDLLTWVLDCGDEIFPGFRLFVLDPVDHLRRIFSRVVFPKMDVSADWFTWLLDCGDEIFPGFRLFVLDPTYQLKVMIADLFGARVDLFDYPGKWAVYWIRNACVDFREEYRGWLLPTIERLIRYIWEGVF